MATTFTKQIHPQDGNWSVIIGITSKDLNDVGLAEQYGDINLDFAGKYVDPTDNTFSFSIHSNTAKYSDILLNKLPNVKFTYVFDDASVLPTTRYRQATIFCNAVQAALTAAFLALRAMPATVPVNTTFAI